MPGSPDPQPQRHQAPASRPPRAISPRRSGTQSLLARARQPGPWSARRAERTRQITAASGRRPHRRGAFAAAREAAATNGARGGAAAACLAVAGTVAIARQTRPTKNDASLFARPGPRGKTGRAPPDGVVKHTYATSDVDAAIKAFGSLPVALAPWGGDAGCSVAVPGDVLKKLGGAPVDCVAYALAAHSFPETYELAPCECECGAVGRVQLLTADDLAGVGSFAEGFGLHHVDAGIGARAMARVSPRSRPPSARPMAVFRSGTRSWT